MRKKITFVFVLLVLAALILPACTSRSSTYSGSRKSTAAASQNAAAISDSSSSVNMLGPGILKLEGTSNAVTQAQAKDLLFLWKAVKALGSSSNTAQAETSALYQQIQETMTAEQVQAIQAMVLSNEDIQALKGLYGIQSSQGLTPGQNSQGQRANMGGFPGEGPPAGFEGEMPGAQGNRASEAAQSPTSPSQDMNALFADALIELLQTRAGAP